jgi:hypothetical protein
MTAPAGPAEPLPPHDAVPLKPRPTLVEPDEVESCRYPKVEPGALNAQPVTTSC